MLFNQHRAEAAMRRCGLDALIATSPVNIRYLTDYHCWLDPLFKEYMSAPGASPDPTQMYAVFTAGGGFALVVSSLFAINAADANADELCLFGEPGLDESLPPGELAADERRFYDLLHDARPAATPTDALAAFLTAHGLAGASIGIELDGLTRGTQASLAASVPNARLRDCSNLFRWVRMVKTAEELARLRRAAEIAARAAHDSLALSRPGRPMADIVADYRIRVAEQGAEFDHFAFSPRGFGIATEPQYPLRDGDMLYIDYGCVYRGYFSDAGLTLALGDPSAGMDRRRTAVFDSIAAGAGALRPGVLASGVQAAMWRALTGHGFTACFPHGHGIGLELRDYPILVPDNGLRLRDDCLDIPSDLPLEPDTVVCLEAGMFVPGVGSVQAEKALRVTADGSEYLVAS